jgi:hypothetical protein
MVVVVLVDYEQTIQHYLHYRLRPDNLMVADYSVYWLQQHTPLT